MTEKKLFIFLISLLLSHPVMKGENISPIETKVSICTEPHHGVFLVADYMLGVDFHHARSFFEPVLSLRSVNKDLLSLSVCLDHSSKGSHIVTLLGDRTSKDSVELQNLAVGDTLRTSLYYDDTKHNLLIKYSIVRESGTIFSDSVVLNHIVIDLNIQYYARGDREGILQCLKIRNLYDQEKAWEYKTISWLLAIVLIDIALFIWIYLKRKRDKKMEKQQQEQDDSHKKVMPDDHLVHTGEIITFGDLQVFDKDGVNVVKKLSPIMKEILLMLICYSLKKGVSSEQMKNLLWYDKDDASARNNRSVYFAKLRTFLEQMGDYELKQENGRWLLTFENIKLDLFRFYEIVRSEVVSKNNVYELLALIQNGKFLSYSNYEWADKFREETTDLAIQILSTYVAQINLKDDPIFIVQIADTLFKLDSLSEVALIYKCKALRELSKHNQAKQLYSSFVKEYYLLYNENFEKSFSSIMIDDQEMS